MKKPNTEVQSVVFDRKKWNLKDAKAWVKDNGYKAIYRNKPIDITDTQYRFRQTPPDKYQSYVSKKLKNNVLLVLGILKK